MSVCICPVAGFCERHKVSKSEHWHHLCQTHEGYRRQWEAGRGPGQFVAPEVVTALTTRRNDQKRQRDELTRALWAELHVSSMTPAKFKKLQSRVPKFGCNCRQFLKEYLRDHPPDYEHWYEYSVAMHNAVNRKLSKPEYSLAESMRKWRPLPICNEPIIGCKIVTAFGPKRLERQQHCLDTWLRSGFEVVALQTDVEMPLMRSTFGDRVTWIEENRVTVDYEFPTQRISRLLGEATDDPILLLNSDCAMTGDTARFLDHLQSRKTHFYLRWNYVDDDIANEFEYGIDGVLIWPGVPSVLRDMPYGIGQPMWDYALPYLLRRNGDDFEIDHYPWLCHEDHAQNWSEKAWWFGANWLCNFTKEQTREYFLATFREGLDPGWKYDRESGEWKLLPTNTTLGSTIVEKVV